MTTPEDAVEVLNRVHAADPSVLQALVSMRVLCNERVREDPTVQVQPVDVGPFDVELPDRYEVGLLGILNGVFGARPDGRGMIEAHVDDDGALTGFRVSP